MSNEETVIVEVSTRSSNHLKNTILKNMLTLVSSTKCCWDEKNYNYWANGLIGKREINGAYVN